MSLKARIEGLEKLRRSKTSGTPPIAVFDRIVNDTITDEEFEQWMPFWEELLREDKSARSTDQVCT